MLECTDSDIKGELLKQTFKYVLSEMTENDENSSLSLIYSSKLDKNENKNELTNILNLFD
jgi:hypothetical protein